MGAAEHRCGAEGRVSVQNVGPSISTADATHMCMHYGYTYVCAFVGLAVCTAEAAAQIKAS